MQKRIVEERNRATEFLLNFAIGKLCSDTESRCLIPYGLFAFGVRKSIDLRFFMQNDVIKVNDMFVRAARSRVPKMQRLAHEIPIVEGMERKKFIFSFYCHCRVLYVRAVARKLTHELNNSFQNPLTIQEVEYEMDSVDLKVAMSPSDGIYTYGIARFLETLPVSEDVAREYGFLESHDARESYRQNQIDAEQRDMEIARLWLEGFSAKKIATELEDQYDNVSLSTVKRCLKRLGLKGKRTDFSMEDITKNWVKRYSRKNSEVFEKKGFNSAQKENKIKNSAATISEDTCQRTNIWNSLTKGEDCCILGAAGTGKTVLLKEFCDYLKGEGKTFKILAPTGCAASHLGGETIHAGLRVPVENLYPSLSQKKDKSAYEEERLNLIYDVDVIIIDEIGMVSRELYSLIRKSIDQVFKKMNHRAQLVVCGDFQQLAPITNEKVDEYAFSLDEDFWMNAHVLKQSYRQNDPLFFGALKDIADGNTKGIHYINEHVKIGILSEELIQELEAGSIYLTSYRSNVDRMNQMMINLHKDDPSYKVFKTDEEDENAICTPVYEGMPILFTKNQKNFVNGTRGIIEKVYKNHILANVDGSKLKIYPSKKYTGKKEFPFVPAYAMTIHKSQGLTLDRIILDPKSFASGQLYTALSRVRSVNDVVLTRSIKEGDVKSSKKVLEYMKKISKKEPGSFLCQQ